MRATIKLGSVTKKIGSGVTPRGGEKVYRTEGEPHLSGARMYMITVLWRTDLFI